MKSPRFCRGGLRSQSSNSFLQMIARHRFGFKFEKIIIELLWENFVSNYQLYCEDPPGVSVCNSKQGSQTLKIYYSNKISVSSDRLRRDVQLEEYPSDRVHCRPLLHSSPV